MSQILDISAKSIGFQQVYCGKMLLMLRNFLRSFFASESLNGSENLISAKQKGIVRSAEQWVTMNSQLVKVSQFYNKTSFV